MKLILLYFLPSVLTAPWYTNDGWELNGPSQCTKTNLDGYYHFCGVGVTSTGKNPYPAAFTNGRDVCQVSGQVCNWQGAPGFTCYQSGQSVVSQAAAHIWQAGASRPDLIDCQGVAEVIFEA